MNIQEETDPRMFLMETLHQYVERQISPTDYLTHIETLHKKPEIATDAILSNCATIADFFAKQIKQGNEDILSRELLDEAYAYIVKKLTASAPLAEDIQNKNLQVYLDRIEWDKKQFTPDRLEAMLAASCLRFLGGLEDISFVFGLSEAIRKNHLDTMTLPLRYATAILHDLAEELDNNTILSTDDTTIKKNIDNAQEVITKRKYKQKL